MDIQSGIYKQFFYARAK